jgi:deazaflavin-dependent oxidoreductase (nitroreductase family)
MAMPQRLQGLPRRLNPILTPIARHVPPLAVLHHRGRKSGKAYDTPVQAFRTPQGFVVGLAYNRDASWVLNLLAAGGGEMTRLGRRYTLTAPRRAGVEALSLLPSWASFVTRRLDVKDFLAFDAADQAP